MQQQQQQQQMMAAMTEEQRQQYYQQMVAYWQGGAGGVASSSYYYYPTAQTNAPQNYYYANTVADPSAAAAAAVGMAGQYQDPQAYAAYYYQWQQYMQQQQQQPTATNPAPAATDDDDDDDDDDEDDDEDEDDEDGKKKKKKKKDAKKKAGPAAFSYDDDGEDCDESDEAVRTARLIPLHGNRATGNINELVVKNIRLSLYFNRRCCEHITDVDGLVAEVEAAAEHLDPWEPGTRARVMPGYALRGVAEGGIVSSAFCLLLRLVGLGVTMKELLAMLRDDAAVVRAFALLFVRYAIDPAQYWRLVGVLVDDEAVVKAHGGDGPGTKMKVGEMAVELLTSKTNKWGDTPLPRIPVLPARSINQAIADWRLKKSSTAATTKHSGDNGRQRDAPADPEATRGRDRS